MEDATFEICVALAMWFFLVAGICIVVTLPLIAYRLGRLISICEVGFINQRADKIPFVKELHGVTRAPFRRSDADDPPTLRDTGEVDPPTLR